MAFNKKLTVILLVFQVVFVILYGLLVEYDHSADAHAPENSLDHDKGGADPDNNPLKPLYPMFQDVHVMMFIGFGFLMTFLKKYSFSSVGINMLLAAFCLEWHILMSGFLHMHDGKIHLDIESLLTADFCAATILISFGALLGKLSPLQLIIMTFIEVIVFTVNEYIGLKIFGAVDVGGSMFVHTFGAYFGLAVARIMYKKDVEESEKEGSNYHSDIFAMIGTIFLWLYWPSFNAALAPGDDQQRAVINTYISLAACTITVFAISSFVNKEAKLDMVHIQNSTLAGGVAVGTCADMMIDPWGAMLIGMTAGTISVIGFRFLTPWMASKLKIHDTCGVNNLHGMPGVIAGIGGAIASAVASTDKYGNSLYQIFPMRVPVENSTELADIQSSLSLVKAGPGRTAGMQAGFQMIALVTTLGIAIVTGLLTGLLLKIPFLDEPKGADVFSDGPIWETPDDFGDEEKLVNGTKKDHLLNEEETRA